MISKIGYLSSVVGFNTNQSQKNKSFGAAGSQKIISELPELRLKVEALYAKSLRMNGIEDSTEALKELIYYQGLLIEKLNANLFGGKFLTSDATKNLTKGVDNLTGPSDTIPITRESAESNKEYLEATIHKQNKLIEEMEKKSTQAAITYRTFTSPFSISSKN